MKFFRSNNRLAIIGPSPATELYWQQQFQSVGFPVTTGKRYARARDDRAVLLVDPDCSLYETLSREVLENVQNRSDFIHLFIVSDDVRWQEVSDPTQPCYVIPLQTHPLEVARFLVEKLNLSFQSHPPAYAFSFFQF